MTYSGYDARGHAGGEADGGHDRTFTYDRAERLVAVAETAGRPLKSFVYATTNAAGNLRKGKLEKAKRYNYYTFEPPPPPDQIFADGFECGDLSAWSAAETGGALLAAPLKYHCEPVSYEAVIDETYVYGGVAGRVSQRDLAITLNGATGETFTQRWTYTELGDLASVTYPKCTFSRCTSDGAGTTRTVSPTYTRGFLTAGNLTSWNGNVYEYDALNMMTRMTSGAEDWLYVYTADDERVWQYKLTSGAPFHRHTLRDLSGQVLREYTALGDFWTVERDY